MSQHSRVPVHRDHDSKIDLKTLVKYVKDDSHISKKKDDPTATAKTTTTTTTENEKNQGQGQSQSQKSKVQFNLSRKGSRSSQIPKPPSNTNPNPNTNFANVSKSSNKISKKSKVSVSNISKVSNVSKSSRARGRVSRIQNKVNPSKSVDSTYTRAFRNEEGQLIKFSIPPYAPALAEDHERTNSETNDSLVSSFKTLQNLGCFPPINGVPLGLEPLVDIESIFIQKRRDPIGIALEVEVISKYDVLNRAGERIYFAGENFNCCTWNCFAQNRPFVLNLFDCNGKIALTIERKRNSRICCWGSRIAGSEVTIKLGEEGHKDILGEIKQQFHPTCLTYKVFKGPPSNSDFVMSISGPCLGAECYFWVTCCRSDFPFTIVYVDDETKETTDKAAGSIYKNYIPKSYSSSAHTFGIEFVHSNLDPTLKAILLGAAFCFNFSYYEDDGCCNTSVWFWVWILIVLGTIIGILVFFKVFRYLFSSNYH